MAKNKSLKSVIRNRLIIPLILFIIIETVLSYFVTLHYVDKTNDRWLLNSARALAQEIKIKDGKATVELPAAALEIVKWNDFDKTHFKINSALTGLLAGEQFVPEPSGIVNWSEPVFFNAKVGNEYMRLVSVRVTNPGTNEEFFVHVGETLYKRKEMMRDILLADLLPQILLVSIASLYLLAGLNQGLKPLYSLAGEIAKRSPRDLSPITDKHIVAEVKILTDTINALLQQLASAISAQQRFIANAAHQLRTPLAGLNVQVERALQEDNLEAMKPALVQMHNSAERMSHTVAQLLILAKAEPVGGLNELCPVDLSQLTRSSCMDWASKALQKQIELEFACPRDPVMVQGDIVLLHELIANLLDNAIRYGRKNGSVIVSVNDKPNPALTVSDDGPGIPQQEQARIFERFYRLPDSPGNGCGLGLAIVKEIADLHQAHLELGNSNDKGGTKISLIFDALKSV